VLQIDSKKAYYRCEAHRAGLRQPEAAPGAVGWPAQPRAGAIARGQPLGISICRTPG